MLCPAHLVIIRYDRVLLSQFRSRSIGYRSYNGFCLSWRFWSTSASMGVHQPTWLMTAAVPTPPTGLRSLSDMMKLDVPPTRTTFGDRSFAVNGPRVWNSLPASINQSINLYSNQAKAHTRTDTYTYRQTRACTKHNHNNIR